MNQGHTYDDGVRRFREHGLLAESFGPAVGEYRPCEIALVKGSAVAREDEIRRQRDQADTAAAARPRYIRRGRDVDLVGQRRLALATIGVRERRVGSAGVVFA